MGEPVEVVKVVMGGAPEDVAHETDIQRHGGSGNPVPRRPLTARGRPAAVAPVPMLGLSPRVFRSSLDHKDTEAPAPPPDALTIPRATMVPSPPKLNRVSYAPTIDVAGIEDESAPTAWETDVRPSPPVVDTSRKRVFGARNNLSKSTGPRPASPSTRTPRTPSRPPPRSPSPRTAKLPQTPRLSPRANSLASPRAESPRSSWGNNSPKESPRPRRRAKAKVKVRPEILLLQKLFRECLERRRCWREQLAHQWTITENTMAAERGGADLRIKKELRDETVRVIVDDKLRHKVKHRLVKPLDPHLSPTVMRGTIKQAIIQTSLAGINLGQTPPPGAEGGVRVHLGEAPEKTWFHRGGWKVNLQEPDALMEHVQGEESEWPTP
mmetsp:Transcript_25217/g.58064  ORF Transcript_25217/g.58064 Transcript_25217/m.58064 type:complete len:381 (+) Transcript_25217:2-1144(+)